MVPRTKLAVQAWESLFRAQVTVIRRLNRAARGSRVSIREYDVLYNLTRFPGNRLRLHELNEHILLDQSSLSRLIERMEIEGLVTRSDDPTDRRGTVIELTEHGAGIQREMGREHATAISNYVGEALTADELRTLHRLCAKLRLAQQDIPA